jgi:hypothetical protein
MIIKYIHFKVNKRHDINLFFNTFLFDKTNQEIFWLHGNYKIRISIYINLEKAGTKIN